MVANKIGYPVMLKATNGGGGRGIRRCDSDKDLVGNFERVISEASKAFGQPEVFLEKCVVNPTAHRGSGAGRQSWQCDPPV